MTKKYVPKKKKYNDLSTLAREMTDNKIRIEFTGHSITTKNQIFTLFDGEILTYDLKNLRESDK